MTRRLKKLLLMLGLLFTAAILVGPRLAAVKAQDKQTTVSVVLHKLLFDNKLPDPEPTDSRWIESLTEKGRPLNGVTFTAYDITDDFWDYSRKHPETPLEDIQTELSKADRQLPRALESHVTKNGGLAVFPALPLKHGRHYAVYLFKETGTPEGIDGESQNLVLVLPATTKKGELQNQIDLYPKNRLFDENQTVDKVVKGNQSNFDYNAPIPYEIRVRVPADIGALKWFKLADNADEHLKRVSGPRVDIDGHNVTGQSRFYKLSKEASNSFMMNFDVDALTPYAGKLITVRYKMVIKKDALADTSFDNTAIVYPSDGKPICDRVSVQTGGKRFVKVDAKNQSRKLQGATFVVKNASGQYLATGKKGWQWRSVAGDIVRVYGETGLHTMTSDENGRFSIQGLARGSYQLVEVKAPKGYLRNREAIPFNIVPGAFSAEKSSPYAVVNVRAPNTPPGNGITKYFPKTGEARAVWLSVIGALMIGFILWQQKNKNVNSKKERN